MSHVHNWTRTLALPFSSLLQTHARREQLMRHKGRKQIRTAWFQMLQERGGEVFCFGLVWPGVLSATTPPAPSFSLLVLALFVFVFPTEYKKVTASHCDSSLQTSVHRSQCGKVQEQKKKNRKKKKQQLRAGAIAAVKLWRMAGCFRHVCPCNHRGPTVI